MRSDESDDLFPSSRNPEGLQFINQRCLLRTQDGHRVVVVAGIPLAQYAVGDRMSEAQAMVNLVALGWADQKEVADAFGCSVRTVRRHQRRFEAGGLAALGRADGYPRGQSRLTPTQQRVMTQLKAQGHSHYEIAHRLKISVQSVRQTLRRLGWKPTAPVQPDLPLHASGGALNSPETPKTGGDPNLSAFSSSPSSARLPASLDTDPSDRQVDRLMARLGLLNDAPALFGSASALPRAGVLLAIPALVQSCIFECAQSIYGSLGPAFFGLRTTILILLLMALWRIKRPEALKEHSPVALGRVLGVDRAPEVKTLRRKLTRLASFQRAAQFGQALAQHRVKLRGEALGFLYIDGHVRVYHGKYPLPKAHVARMRLSMPATTDYWVNDATGDPLFVVTAEVNAGLVKMLPGLLTELRRLMGSRRLTIVFDRGGFSPLLFQQIVAAGLDFLTYRKGRVRRIPARCFHTRRTRVDGRTFTYRLADQEVRLLKGRLRLRQVTRLSDDSHQTPILTSRRDLAAAQVAYWMFNRWRQENFFKYLREEFLLDALAEYAVVPDDPKREVPNPEWARVDAQWRQAQAHFDRLQSEYGLAAWTNLERRRRTMRGFKIAHSKLEEQLCTACYRMTRLEARRNKIPRRVPVQSLSAEPVVKLAPEVKHLTNLVKMVAYQAESELVRTVTPHYRRVNDEGRTLIQAALLSAADLEVTETELRVTLVPQSSPHRTRAIAALCKDLDSMDVLFPGSPLRLRYAIHGAP